MTHGPTAVDARLLQRLTQSLDDCLARDIPALRRQMDTLQARCARAQAIDRALRRLQSDVQNSLHHVAARRAGLPVPDFPLALPVVARRDDILAALEAHQVVVLCGETGSGKTTQLPKLCLQLGRGSRGKIAHTQPRRLAARSLAARMAQELHGRLGEQVGYKIRFQDRVRDSTYVKVLTDGMLLAEIQSDPELREYDTLIIDEAHERSLNIDFLLGYLHRLLPRRPDLKLIITSATIDPQRFSKHFNGAPVIEVSGRTYPVEIRYRPVQADDEEQAPGASGQALLAAVDELAAEGPGDILVFLPGERAIRESAESLRKHHPPHTSILPLYARLSAAQQNEVFAAHTGRRIVLATNVAETSLTVPGIRYVVDTGVARISRYNYRTKVQRLPIEAVSQASANQRAGRCGRVAAGICIRLYSEADYLARDEFTTAEIRRTNLAAVILQMTYQGLGAIEDFPFVEPPDPRFIRDGYQLLQELGAVDARSRLTPLGSRIARLPVDPRLARMLLAAHDNRCLSEMLVIVSVLESSDPRDRPLEHRQAADEKQALFVDPHSDFSSYLKLWKAYAEQSRHLSQNKLRKWCREHFISSLRMREWLDIHRQLQARVHALGLSGNVEAADYQAVHTALLSGLLGNVAMHTGADEYLGARNLKFNLFPGSALGKKRPRWLVAAELVETGKRYLRSVAAIEPEWLEPLAGHLVKRSYIEPHWEKRRAAVVAFENVSLYGLPLVQGRKVDYAKIDPQVTRELFIRHALVYGEWQLREPFVEHNRALLDELQHLEAKSRRRDLIVDEQQLYDFFDQRVIDAVVDLSSFRRWWKQAGKQQPELLFLQPEVVMQHDATAINAEQFPDSLTVRGLQLALLYHFEPGKERDGLLVQVPLVALNQLQSADFDWLVPGLRKAKCVALIKSLPKALRRHFVPAPDFAEACLQATEQASGSLSDFLAAQLQRISGIEVPASAWRVEQLPVHLHAVYEVLDAKGRFLAQGRDLVALQQQFGDQVRQGFAGPSTSGYERLDVQDWDFGELPAHVEFVREGVRLRGYPALTLREQRIDLCLFDRPGEAEAAHREGLLALFRKHSGTIVRDIRRAIADFDKQTLWFSTTGAAGVLLADLERAALQTAFLSEGGEGITDAQSFQRQLATGRGRLLSDAVAIGAHSYQALQAYQQVRRKLKEPLAPPLLAVAGEVQTQVQQLVYAGFLSATPPAWMPHLARYLQGALRRLEQAGSNLARDREQARLVALHSERYSQALARGTSSAELVRLRWLIEELRVSLFAQSLGTAEKVSAQRLDRLWRELSG